MSQSQTLTRGLRFILAHPVTTLRWAAFSYSDPLRHAAGELADETAWSERVARYRIPFERFLELYHLEPFSPVRLMHTVPQSQSVRSFELYVLATLCRCLSARTVLEIGTYKGRTAYNLAANLASGGRLHTLNYRAPDFREAFVVGEMYRGTPLESVIETIEGDSMTFDFSPWAGTVDLMFIDGNHSAAYVRKDSETAFRCVRPGGVIAWHDIDPTHPEVTAAALEVCERQGAKCWLIEDTQTLLVVAGG